MRVGIPSLYKTGTGGWQIIWNQHSLPPRNQGASTSVLFLITKSFYLPDVVFSYDCIAWLVSSRDHKQLDYPSVFLGQSLLVVLYLVNSVTCDGPSLVLLEYSVRSKKTFHKYGHEGIMGRNSKDREGAKLRSCKRLEMLLM